MRATGLIAALIALASYAPQTSASDLDDTAIASYLDRHPDSIERIVKDYLIANPDVIEDALKEMLRRRAENTQSQDKVVISKNSEALFTAKNAVVLGNPDGDVTLVEFFDYNCHFCRQDLGAMTRLLDDDPNLRVILKEMPVLGANSMAAARVAVSLRNQDQSAKTYLAFHQELLTTAGQADQSTAMDAAIGLNIDKNALERDYYSLETTNSLQQSLDLAKNLGLTGTPTYIVGDTIIRGAAGFENLKSQIALARARE